jgi:NADH:ubiquinone oxidoreductase subunit F (NADH-binding)
MMMDQIKTEKNGNRVEMLEKMKKEAEYMAANSLCPLGASPILPLASTFKYFKEHF